MIVVADASPLQYLIRIKAIDVLPLLYQRVLIPYSVAHELQQDNTPAPVRVWIARRPPGVKFAPIRLLTLHSRFSIPVNEPRLPFFNRFGRTAYLWMNGKGGWRRSAGACPSREHWVYSPARIWLACSISSRRQANCDKRISMCRMA
jgi:hypothetical protein